MIRARYSENIRKHSSNGGKTCNPAIEKQNEVQKKVERGTAEGDAVYALEGNSAKGNVLPGSLYGRAADEGGMKGQNVAKD